MSQTPYSSDPFADLDGLLGDAGIVVDSGTGSPTELSGDGSVGTEAFGGLVLAFMLGVAGFAYLMSVRSRMGRRGTFGKILLVCSALLMLSFFVGF